MVYLEKAIEVISKIKENGFEAYFVGGFVRDYLLGVKENDIDIATNALPLDLQNIFPLINKGIKYNSVIIMFDGYSFEATTYRVDLSYTDYRHPQYKVAKSINEDLARRDFTINALAMSDDFKIIDLFNGQDDLNKGLIRTVNEPIKRFTEDSLRMLRACYFAAKLNFKIENKTFEGIKKCAYLVQHLSFDRITWELNKVFDANYNLVGIKYLIESTLWVYLGPYKKSLYLLNEKQEKVPWILFLAISFIDCPELLKDIHFKNNEARKIVEIINAANNLKNNPVDSSMVFALGRPNLLLANKVNMLLYNDKDYSKLICSIDENLVIHSRSELKIKAAKIKEYIPSIPPTCYGDIFDMILKYVLAHKLENNEEKILKFIIKQQKAYKK